jgi:hypothetical protein
MEMSLTSNLKMLCRKGPENDMQAQAKRANLAYLDRSEMQSTGLAEKSVEGRSKIQRRAQTLSTRRGEKANLVVVGGEGKAKERNFQPRDWANRGE